jgi:hypothetical protein
MVEVGSIIALKHIEISIQTKQIAEKYCKECCVYIATYTTGRSGQAYQRIEEKSGEEFWSLKAWTPPPHRRLKDPDLIITHNQQVTFLVEVKWGALPGWDTTDLLISPQEWCKMARLFKEPAMCRARGPAVKNGNRFRSANFQIEQDFYTNAKTQGILVSDFHGLGEANLNKFLSMWQNEKSGFLIADIHTRVGEIPSFGEMIERNCDI